MGNDMCGLIKSKESKDVDSASLQQEELRYLKLMYTDLSIRSKEQKLTREVFDTFFHLNGMWGQQMFRKFDQNNEGIIIFEEFKDSFKLMVRGNQRERAKFLFQLYDVDKTGGVSFDELLRMLYSYPKDDLKQMVTDEQFLKTIDAVQLAHYFGPQKQIDDKLIMQYEEESAQNQEQLKRKQSDYHPSSSFVLKIQEDLWKEAAKSKQKSTKRKKYGRKGGSLTEFPTFIRNKKMKVTNNVASLVKKYANFIFKQLRLDKDHEEMNEDQFLQIVHRQTSIFNVYMDGFHLYIWQIEDDGTPQYTKMTPWIEGMCIEVLHKQKTYKYLRYVRTTLFIFNSKKSKVPVEIKNMEGLIVEGIQKVEHGVGICIKHRDGIYPQKSYYFKEKEQQLEWLRFMSQFKLNSVYNKYQFIEKIGEGNFSSVYRGIVKDTNKNVAIKVIQKFKLSQNQKEVIKLECGILELCHHPNIIHLQEHYITKSNIYIVTELMDEGDLFQYTKKSSFLEQYEAAIILKQLIQAILYLNHELGLIHRDLKPENVLVETNKQKKEIGRVRLIDFGFAIYKSNIKNLSNKEKYAGTPGFLAPEVYLQQDYDEGVDMFSLGIIMYFMLYGQLPFSSPIYDEIREMTIDCEISFSSIHWMNVSDHAKDLISKILVHKEKRIKGKQALEHPWLKNIEDLRSRIGQNKKNRYI